ncbi:aldo/keto reductase [Alkalihalobacillus sp. LMS39]|uniref:aldo/keto reductase n=1 Tax=Alkalihalobacillus sp. LMS39 TaxID=2924032 RepID=UPI001FB50DFA|nr:aldo/keto reductase [Alkalihalobacillus sp. LMS39]UOE92469.1 aldo/keto reductase [Alkalihalobacillus sp. LMS39]
MKVMPLEKRMITTSRLVYGCMGLGGDWNAAPITEENIKQAEEAIDAVLSIGVTMFDHADIYKRGKSEQVFGEVLKRQPQLRERIVIQSKCGIRFPEGEIPQRYDFSKDHIVNSVDGILHRLGIEQLDILLLHRPDPLIEPEDVAEAFEQLIKAGKVKHFGVSNMNAAQMRMIQAYVEDPLVVNQLELSLKRIDFLEEGVFVNQQAGTNIHFGDGIIEHCQLETIQIQAWAPLANGIYSGREMELQSEADKRTKALVTRLATEKNTTPEAIVLGWLMRHPAKIQPVIGTSHPERIGKCKEAIEIAETMTREEWYMLYETSRGMRMP